LRVARPERILQFQFNKRATRKTPMNFPIRTIALASAVTLVSAFTVTTPSFAQSQDASSQSVAEAARKAKERKKASPKDNRVITDDTINLRPASADATGAPPAGTVVTTIPGATSSDATATTTSTSAAGASTEVSVAAKSIDTAATDARKKAEAAAAAAKTKELLAQALNQLDVLKRELALDSDSFYSNPDYAHDANGKSKLDALKQSIGDKAVSVEDLKRQLTELMEKAGISLDEPKPAAPPQR